MEQSFSTMIEISDKIIMGISDRMLFIHMDLFCNADECKYAQNNMCRLKDVLHDTNVVLEENNAKVEISNNRRIDLICEGPRPLVDFAVALEKLKEKWQHLDQFFVCECSLRDELSKVHSGYMKYVDEILSADNTLI